MQLADLHYLTVANSVANLSDDQTRIRVATIDILYTLDSASN